jgi:hypothetical protein
MWYMHTMDYLAINSKAIKKKKLPTEWGATHQRINNQNIQGGKKLNSKKLT